MDVDIPVKVATTTGVWTAAGAWVSALGIMAALVTAWVKFGWKWRELGIGERRGDLDDMRKRIGDLEAKVDSASAAAHSAEMKLVYAVSAVQLLAAKIRADNPNDPALLQAMELLKAATSGELPSWANKLAAGVADAQGARE